MKKCMLFQGLLCVLILSYGDVIAMGREYRPEEQEPHKAKVTNQEYYYRLLQQQESRELGRHMTGDETPSAPGVDDESYTGHDGGISLQVATAPSDKQEYNQEGFRLQPTTQPDEIEQAAKDATMDGGDTYEEQEQSAKVTNQEAARITELGRHMTGDETTSALGDDQEYNQGGGFRLQPTAPPDEIEELAKANEAQKALNSFYEAYRNDWNELNQNQQKEFKELLKRAVKAKVALIIDSDENVADKKGLKDTTNKGIDSLLGGLDYKVLYPRVEGLTRIEEMVVNIVQGEGGVERYLSYKDATEISDLLKQNKLYDDLIKAFGLSSVVLAVIIAAVLLDAQLSS